ncbi:hypothetical protein QFC19_002995 [Naganishia cerealis]|uniref:Uncharacterized protein n=2 Tax=Naganishia cerealis TaxID=610337 RepID=A0ACC2W3M5_9TREE|nr:hypothetical protein QFC19_003331 [Naganishia cerealis]KAJ9106866.1 hypothetical protein QFC19_002995 [Naganishia cerealis]
MKVLLMRTMKNEHDALRRPDKYQQAVREHLSNAKRLGEEEGVLGTNIIRVDASGAPIRETWGYQHDSDASVQDDEEQEVALLVPPKVQNNPLTFGNSHQKSREIESEPQYAARLENERRKAIEDVDGYTWNTMEDEAGDCIQDEDKDESSEYSEKEVCIPAGGKESRRAREPPEDSAEADNRSAGEAELGMPVG